MKRRIWFWLILSGALTFFEIITGCGKKDKMKEIERVRREADKKKGKIK